MTGGRRRRVAGLVGLVGLVVAGAVIGSSGTAPVALPAARDVTEPAWLPPARPPLVLVRAFDGPARYAAGHRGVDLRLGVGAEVRSPGDGTVRFAGPVAGRGVVTVDVHVPDRGTLRFSYEPLVPLVRAGEPVRPGQVLGHLAPGHPGCADCLHWGLRQDTGTPDEHYLDPLRAGGPRPRLLPLEGYGVRDAGAVSSARSRR